MPVGEEEQIRAMLEAMGAESIDEFAASVPDPFDAFSALAAENNSEKPSEVPPVITHAAASFASKPEVKPTPIPQAQVTLATLVHLMGVATASHSHLLERKIDLLSEKLNALRARVEPLCLKDAALDEQESSDRISKQLSEIRTLLSKLLIANGIEDRRPKEPDTRGIYSSRILTSGDGPLEPPTRANSAPGESVDLSEAERKAMSDEAFQLAESQRMRTRQQQ